MLRPSLARLRPNYMEAKHGPESDLWLVVGHLLHDLSLGHWSQALVWARALVRHVAEKAAE